MNIANQRAHGCSAQRPPAASEPDDARGDREPAPQPDVVEGWQVTECPEPVEADDAQAEEQETEPRERREKAEDRR